MTWSNVDAENTSLVDEFTTDCSRLRSYKLQRNAGQCCVAVIQLHGNEAIPAIEEQILVGECGCCGLRNTAKQAETEIITRDCIETSLSMQILRSRTTEPGADAGGDRWVGLHASTRFGPASARLYNVLFCTSLKSITV